jgi:hypothetical protein
MSITTTLLGLLCLCAGAAFGFLLCAILSSNKPHEDDVPEDTLRLDALRDTNCGLIFADNYWGVVNNGKVDALAMCPRVAIDRFRVEIAQAEALGAEAGVPAHG